MIYNERNENSNIIIEEFIDENITKKILGRQLAAVNISELSFTGGFKVLVDFVQSSLRSSLNGKNINAIKNLDVITTNLVIPSKSGRNIANFLDVSYFYLIQITFY